MPEDEARISTLNQSDDSSSAEPEATLNDTGEPSAPKVDEGELLDTVEPVEEIPKAEDADSQEEDGDDKDEKKVSEHVPYDRFQEVVAKSGKFETEAIELREKIAKLEGRFEASPEHQGEKTEDPGYKNIAGMSDDQIAEWMDEKPLEFASNLALQVQTETLSAVEQFLKDRETKSIEKNRQKSVKDTLKGYAEENPDFKAMKPDIQRYMEENPGHTQISAHMALTSERRTEEAVKKAVAEAEQRKEKEFKSKKTVRVLNAGTTRPATGRTAPELADTKKYGGVTTVLAERLRALRGQRT